ncbi:PepSY-associated TM helix domain-containing protein [Aliarcobacter lanthieri]|uniref:PepSY-associated TM helix domain-containing protein n=1 Tax=Aliarcobacter lanthieri TaxID=1355374 RepID=UPI003AAC92A1
MNIEKSCNEEKLKEVENKENSKLLKQRLQRVHVVIGIWFSVFMYIALFFGIFAIFLPYIANWERPSNHKKIVNIENIDFDKTIQKVLDDKEYPKYNTIFVNLPNKSPNLSISTQFMERKVFNPITNEELKKVKEDSNLAWFLNRMHYGAPLYKIYMREIFGFVALAGLFLIIGGLIQVSIIKYQNGGKSVSSKFSNWHRKIFIWLFLPFLLIVWSGANLNVPMNYVKQSSFMTYVVSKGEFSDYWEYKQYLRELENPKQEEVKISGIEASMLSLNELTNKALQINKDIDFKWIRLENWEDKDAKITFRGHNQYVPFLKDEKTFPSITLSGVDGSLIEENLFEDRHYSFIISDSIHYLHILVNHGIWLRLFVFVTMLLCTLAVGFGVLLYLEKQARKFPTTTPVYNWVSKFCLAGMVGVIPATGLLFVLQWILPFDMENRITIQHGLFATFWIGTLTYSFYRINSYKVAKEFLYLGGVLFALSPFIHFISSGFSPIRLWSEEIYSVLSVDIGLFIFGLILLYVAYKLPVDRKKIQDFWAKRL